MGTAGTLHIEIRANSLNNILLLKRPKVRFQHIQRETTQNNKKGCDKIQQSWLTTMPPRERQTSWNWDVKN
jgi:hypothetical protein